MPNHSIPPKSHTYLPDRVTPKSSPEALHEKGALLKLIRILPASEQEHPRPTHKNTPYQK